MKLTNRQKLGYKEIERIHHVTYRESYIWLDIRIGKIPVKSVE
ncbi:hypothetical protein [Lentibacillus amyloliquefaciens]|nr:hypothetical protein [Lentibacillus amyloliquefaciens]